MFTKNSRNQYDKKDSLELGQRAESQFATLAIKHGWNVTPASAHSNIHEHYDYLMEKEGKSFKVEVKSLKRMNRRDALPQDQLVWVELHGVRAHDAGWLYGLADLLAFELSRSFRLVRRTDLLELVQRLVDFEARVQSPQEALYKLYSRKNRPDLLALIRADDLLNITSLDWGKED